MRVATYVLALLPTSLVGCRPATTPAAPPAPEPPSQTASTPPPVEPEPPQLPEVSSNLDDTADPCQDFYRFSCGGWLDRTERPADEPRYGRFHVLDEQNTQALREILEASSPTADDPDEARLAEFYRACVDEARIDALGSTPLDPLFRRIEAVRRPRELMRVAGEIQRAGGTALLSFEVGPDYENPATNVAHLFQGGLGLPAREYYLDDDAASVELREAYVRHVSRMLELAGLPADAAPRILAFETRLAQAAIPRAEFRDPQRRHNPMSPSTLDRLTRGLRWAPFFEGIGRPDMQALNVAPPEFFEALAKTIAQVGLPTAKAYLQWQVLHDSAEQLSSDLATEHFEFFRKRLRGQQEPAPRWKQCTRTTDALLGDALGARYVADNFPGDSRQTALDMIEQIERAFEVSLPALAWMDPATQERALSKMESVVNKIGYPDHWRDDAALQIGGDHFANVVAAATFEFDRKAAEVGRPVDKSEWHMSAPTVNAYYNSTNNEMVFPAGILQSPFFDPEAPMAMNFGGIGMVMGHELTHGFDDQGRKFDGSGRLRQWWEDAAIERFEARAECIDTLYDSYEIQPGVTLDGQLTLGENIADFGGIKQAHAAYLSWASAHDEDPKAAAAGALTSEQLFFVAFGQIWCTHTTPEIERVLALTDTHASSKYRVNGPLSNFPAFWEAFACGEGTPMRATAACEVW